MYCLYSKNRVWEYLVTPPRLKSDLSDKVCNILDWYLLYYCMLIALIRWIFLQIFHYFPYRIMFTTSPSFKNLGMISSKLYCGGVSLKLLNTTEQAASQVCLVKPSQSFVASFMVCWFHSVYHSTCCLTSSWVTKAMESISSHPSDKSM